MAGFCALACLSFLPLAAAQEADPKAHEAACGKEIAAFKAAIESAKSPREEALAILKIGASPVKNSKMAAELGPYLKVRSDDPHLVLPWTAIDALSRFRGNARAARLLMGAHAKFSRIPYLGPKAYQGIARVGHPAALPMYMKDLKSKNAKRAVAAIDSLKEMPSALIIELLINEWEDAKKKEANAGPKLKAFYAATIPALEKATKDVAGVLYPSITEMRLWWRKRGKRFKERSVEDERARLSQEASSAPTTLPPPLLLELRFEKNTGNKTLNTGILSGKVPSGRVTGAGWSFLPGTPGVSTRRGTSLDLGKKAHLSAVDLSGNLQFLRNLKSFTLMGWFNLRSDEVGATGNRLITWYKEGAGGVELILRKEGRLQLGVNESAEDSKAISEKYFLPVIKEGVAGSLDLAWWFFAVTYDSTAKSGHVNFYICQDGISTRPVGACDYARGPVAEKTGGVLSVGNIDPGRRSKVRDAGFRGLVDDVRIVGSAEDASGALKIMYLRDYLGGR